MKPDHSLEVVILAAGEGTRMNSVRPKVLHTIGGVPLLQRVVNTAVELEAEAVHVVVGFGEMEIRQGIQGDVNWVPQKERLGTGHAVMQALPFIDPGSMVVILCGDVPLIRSATINKLLRAAQSGLAILTAEVDNPAGLGRILRNSEGEICAVVEHRDAAAEQLKISEINSGVIAAPAANLQRWLPQVKADNDQSEYYLPDIIAPALEEKVIVGNAMPQQLHEIAGVNDRVQLAQLERIFQRQQAEDLQRGGVTLADPSRVDIRGSLQCARDVYVDVNVVFSGAVVLGEGVSIGANCVITDCEIRGGATVHPNSVLEGATVGEQCNVGPFARLRPGTKLGEGARVGNFVETKKADIGSGSKVNHLSYVGDCDMGAGVNIGAGTITCNYDGVNKHKTTLGDGVFIGSNSTLVAPIEVEQEGFVAAGTTLTRTVPRRSLAVGRAKQRNIEKWKRPGWDEQ